MSAHAELARFLILERSGNLSSLSRRGGIARSSSAKVRGSDRPWRLLAADRPDCQGRTLRGSDLSRRFELSSAAPFARSTPPTALSPCPSPLKGTQRAALSLPASVWLDRRQNGVRSPVSLSGSSGDRQSRRSNAQPLRLPLAVLNSSANSRLTDSRKCDVAIVSTEQSWNRMKAKPQASLLLTTPQPATMRREMFLNQRK